MPIQAPQWSDFRLCPVCQSEFNNKTKPPISLGCGHSICKSCLVRLSKQQCPFDQAEIKIDIKKLPINYALLSLVGTKTLDFFEVDIDEVKNHRIEFDDARKAIEYLADYLQNVYIVGNANMGHSTGSGTLTRPMQRKLVTLLHSQLAEEEGRARAMRSARSIGERVVKELILMHQSPQTLSAALWAAVRQRGCQFLGPAMQEAVLRLILLSLEDGISLSRKVLVLFVVQKLEKQYTQASKTSIGHVVQLLYRASCFKVTKRDGDSSLLQLHEKYRTYSALRKEHDAQIVQIATEAGLHISPEQWSALLYGDDEHKSHMQSIIDKLQTPASFASSIQELIIALQRTDDPHDLQSLRTHLDKLSSIDPSPEAEPPQWDSLQECMQSLVIVVEGLQKFAKDYASKNKGNIEGAQMINTKYRTSMCRDILQRNTCPRGANCNFAHSEEELERYRKRRNMPVSNRNMTNNVMNGSMYNGSSRAGSNSSPDSCGADDDDFLIEQQKNSPNMHRSISAVMQGNNGVTSANYRNGMIFPSDVNGGLSRTFNKSMNINGNIQHSSMATKKDEGRDLIKSGGNYDGQQPMNGNRMSMYNHQQVPFANQQQQSAFFNAPMHSQNQAPMFVSNDHFLQSNGYVYQQPAAMPQVFPYDNFQSFPAMYPNTPFGHNNFAMPTATARGSSNEDNTHLLKTTSNELSLSIPALKDTKEDSWSLCGNKPSLFVRGDMDSGRGSSIGNSSTDTFSPLSNTSAGSSSESRKIWGNDIWAPSSDTWSKNNWEARFENSRLSDQEERNVSSESVGKNGDIQVRAFSESKSYSSLQDWSTSASDFINNNHQDLLQLLSPSTTKRQQPPPPGFPMLR